MYKLIANIKKTADLVNFAVFNTMTPNENDLCMTLRHGRGTLLRRRSGQDFSQMLVVLAIIVPVGIGMILYLTGNLNNAMNWIVSKIQSLLS